MPEETTEMAATAAPAGLPPSMVRSETVLWREKRVRLVRGVVLVGVGESGTEWDAPPHRSLPSRSLSPSIPLSCHSQNVHNGDTHHHRDRRRHLAGEAAPEPGALHAAHKRDDEQFGHLVEPHRVQHEGQVEGDDGCVGGGREDGQVWVWVEKGSAGREGEGEQHEEGTCPGRRV